MLPGHYQPAYISTAPPDTTGPAAHTLLPPSVWPENPRSSQSHAPHRSPPAHPASLPIPGDSAPAGWLGHLTLHSSTALPHKSPPPLAAFLRPVLRITDARTYRTSTATPCG